MTTSEQINEIAAALAKAQAGMKNASLNKVNPHFKSKYADLAGIRDTVVPVLAANGIAVAQTLDHYLSGPEGHSGVGVYTRLVHTSGQWIESMCPIPAVLDMQKMGSAITYARRYSLSAICGIAADEDDDGNAAATARDGSITDADYGDWLADIRAFAETGPGLDKVIKLVAESRPDLKNRLRADKKTWKAIEELAARKEAVPA